MADDQQRIHFKIAVVGLPAVGKSTFINALHGKLNTSPEPTQGCNKSNLIRSECSLDILDMGGRSEVRQFWPRLAADVHALIVLVNASTVEDGMDPTSWMNLAADLQKLRNDRPVLLLLTQRDMGAYPCVAPEEALDRLQLDVDGLDPDVSARVLPNSSDVAAAEPGLAWLCRVLLGEEDEDDDDEPPLREPAAEPQPPLQEQAASVSPSAARGPRRLRALQAVEEARQFAAQEENELEDIQRRLIEGHIVSEEELEMLRAQQRG